jgi:hypothetical protein
VYAVHRPTSPDRLSDHVADFEPVVEHFELMEHLNLGKRSPESLQGLAQRLQQIEQHANERLVRKCNEHLWRVFQRHCETHALADLGYFFDQRIWDKACEDSLPILHQSLERGYREADETFFNRIYQQTFEVLRVTCDAEQECRRAQQLAWRDSGVADLDLDNRSSTSSRPASTSQTSIRTSSAMDHDWQHPQSPESGRPAETRYCPIAPAPMTNRTRGDGMGVPLPQDPGLHGRGPGLRKTFSSRARGPSITHSISLPPMQDGGAETDSMPNWPYNARREHQDRGWDDDRY